MYEKIKEILGRASAILVEPDRDLNAKIKSYIGPYLSRLECCFDAAQALESYGRDGASLIISSIDLPDLSGAEMARRIRALDEFVPIVFMANDSDENVLLALALAGAGFLKKPFDKRELIITLSFVVNKFNADFATVSLGQGFEFDSVSFILRRFGNQVPLTRKEAKLLHLLLKNQTRIVSFDMIQNFVWAGESCSTEAIRSFVYKLRKKLYPELIQNAQGSGYVLCIGRCENNRTINGVSYI